MNIIKRMTGNLSKARVYFVNLLPSHGQYHESLIPPSSLLGRRQVAFFQTQELSETLVLVDVVVISHNAFSVD